MRVKSESEIKLLMDDFYGNDATKASDAKTELLKYGEELIRSSEFEAYQDLIKGCAGVIADKGIDVTPTERTVIGGVAQEASLVPAPIKLMKDFEKQAQDELGRDTEHAEEVKQTREIVEKLAKVLSRQRDIMEKVGRDPSSLEDFLKAIDANNDLTRKSIEIDEKKIKHFKEYFPDEDSQTTINPEADTYKDSQYDKVDRADRQVQLLEDLKTTIDALKQNEENRKKYQRQVDDGDEDAKANVEACKRKEAELREKISKVSPEGRETGLIQRLKDFDITPSYITEIDIDSRDSYEVIGQRVDAVMEKVQKERYSAYEAMARTVVKTLEEKGVVDKTSKRYPESEAGRMHTNFSRLFFATSTKKNDPNFYFNEETQDDLEEVMKNLKAYVKYVKDEIVMTQDRVAESNDAIEFRNETKTEIEEQKRLQKEAKDKADRLRVEPVSDDQKEAWLNENIEIVAGRNEDGTERRETVVAKDGIERRAQAKARNDYKNTGSNKFTKWVRNVGFFLTHGFKSRDTMIAEKAASLAEQEKDTYISRRKEEQVRMAEAEAVSAGRRLNGIETISRESRNDKSLHEAAHNAAANITDLTGKRARDVERAETQTAGNLSNMGYDIALQKWRNGDMSQAEFDRILKEHLDTTREQKDRYVAPDETKGYTKTPEYRNKPNTHREPPTTTEHEETDGHGEH